MKEAKDQDPSDLGLAGYAKLLCSAVFVTGTGEEAARRHSRNVAVDLLKLPESDLEHLDDVIDYDRKRVHATLPGGYRRTAGFYGDQGCIVHPRDHDGIYFDPVPVRTALPPADTQPWPMGDLIPEDPLPPEVDKERLRAAVELAFQPPARTTSMAVVYKGRLVAERYAPEIRKDTLLESWSMGKSLTGTLAGRLIQQGRLKMTGPAPVPEWQTPDDPRRRIRMEDLFRMSSGLDFTLYEVMEQTPQGTYRISTSYPDHYYVYPCALDVFQYAVSRRLRFPPGTVGRYRNCDPLTLGYLVRRAVEQRGEQYHTFPQRSLFDRIGIRRMVLDTDPYGNFILSGYEYGTVRDWARIGLLYLQGGVWQGERLLPKEFVEFVRTPAPAWFNEEGEPSESRYGAMWWLNTTGVWDAPADAFYAAGAGGQNTLVIPSRDLVVARLTEYDVLSVSVPAFNAALRGIQDAIG